MALAMPTALIERHGLQPLQGVYSGHNYADALYQGMASAVPIKPIKKTWALAPAGMFFCRVNNPNA